MIEAQSGKYNFHQIEKEGFEKGNKNEAHISIFMLNMWTIEFHTPPFSIPPPFHSGEIRSIWRRGPSPGSFGPAKGLHYFLGTSLDYSVKSPLDSFIVEILELVLEDRNPLSREIHHKGESVEV